jgi:Cu(I)/Ag(I) efflux system periplasmic protein CusF
MKVHALSVLALTAALAACGSKTETNEAAATNTAAPAATETNAMAGDMGNMAMSPTGGPVRECSKTYAKHPDRSDGGGAA